MLQKVLLRCFISIQERNLQIKFWILRRYAIPATHRGQEAGPPALSPPEALFYEKPWGRVVTAGGVKMGRRRPSRLDSPFPRHSISFFRFRFTITFLFSKTPRRHGKQCWAVSSKNSLKSVVPLEPVHWFVL